MRQRICIILASLLFVYVSGLFGAPDAATARVQNMVVMGISSQPISSTAGRLPSSLKSLQLPDSNASVRLNVNFLSNTNHGFSADFSIWTNFPIQISWADDVERKTALFTSANNGVSESLLSVFKNSLENKNVTMDIRAYDDEWYLKESGRYGMTMALYLKAR